jgi:hypothetical protein
MPTTRKLTDEEVVRLNRGRGGPVDLTPYTDALQELAVGDWGVVELERYDTVRTVKRRTTSAAKQQGKQLVWKRQRDGLLPFEVRAVEKQPSTQSTAAPMKRGRPGQPRSGRATPSQRRTGQG